MATEKQIRANRENAKKSTGPRTAAGRAKAARNSLRHGAYARSIVLDAESRQRFHQLLSDLEKSIQPQNVTESSLVQDMAVARWHLMNIWAMEKAAIASEITHKHLEHPDPATRGAVAFRSLVGSSRYLDVMFRKEDGYLSQFHGALNLLMQLRGMQI
jgi:hypothetical protein